MRTLLCVFPKVFPTSRCVLPAKNERDSGGNRVKKADVAKYLESTTGEAPQVVWGVPGTPGGKDYGAGLFDYIAGAPPLVHFPALPPGPVSSCCVKHAFAARVTVSSLCALLAQAGGSHAAM
jgi:hypothetical protein